MRRRTDAGEWVFFGQVHCMCMLVGTGMRVNAASSAQFTRYVIVKTTLIVYVILLVCLLFQIYLVAWAVESQPIRFWMFSIPENLS